MADTINRIESVKLTEQIFDLEKMRPGRTLCIELSQGEICTYYTEYKKRKRVGLSKTLVSKEEMEAFFEELFQLEQDTEDISSNGKFLVVVIYDIIDNKRRLK